MQFTTLKTVKTLIVLGCSFAGLARAQQRICNNSPALCDRKFNNVTYLGAHDSPFVRNASNGYSPFGDQFYSSVTQLDAGVRLLTGQVHKNNTSWDLCHTACFFLDAGPLTDWLKGIKSWLDSNPNDVVTILLVNSDNADASTLNGLFEAADIVSYGYAPSDTSRATSDWPTLSSMIDSGKRLVTFVANLPPANNTVAPYLLDEFTFAFENNYDNDSPQDFSCEVNRPSTIESKSISQVLQAGYLPIMNHFLYDNTNGIEYPSVENLQNTNAFTGQVGNLGDAAKNCTSFYGGRPPNYILVDFFNVANAIETVDYLNGVRGNTSGRISLPDSAAGSTLTPSPVSQPAATSAVVRSQQSSSAVSSANAAETTSATSTSLAAPSSTTGAAGSLSVSSALSILTVIVSLRAMFSL